MSKNSTTEEFIEKAKAIHKDKYDYSKVNYINACTKVIIICPEHGEFEQNPNNHLNGNGCNKCTGNYNYTTKEWILEAKKVHENKYDYSKVNYINACTKVIIICPEHGEFEQRPDNHTSGKGCSKCTSSKGEKTLLELFTNSAVSIKREYSYSDLIGTGGGLLRFDFAIFENDDLKFLLEYQGIQHFKPWGNTEELIKSSECTQYHDKLKLEYCENNSIPLEFINYDQDIEERFNYLLEKYKLGQ